MLSPKSKASKGSHFSQSALMRGTCGAILVMQKHNNSCGSGCIYRTFRKNQTQLSP